MKKMIVHAAAGAVIFSMLVAAEVFAKPPLPVTTASSVTAKPQRIGFINLQKILFTSHRGKAAKAKLDGEKNAATRVLQTKKKELESMRDELKRQEGTLKQEALAAKYEAYQRKLAEFQSEYQQKMEDLQAHDYNLTKDILTEISPIIERLAKQYGYDYILEKTGSNLIFANVAYDITPQTIAIYDATPSKARSTAGKKPVHRRKK